MLGSEKKHANVQFLIHKVETFRRQSIVLRQDIPELIFTTSKAQLLEKARSVELIDLWASLLRDRKNEARSKREDHMPPFFHEREQAGQAGEQDR